MTEVYQRKPRILGIQMPDAAPWRSIAAVVVGGAVALAALALAAVAEWVIERAGR